MTRKIRFIKYQGIKISTPQQLQELSKHGVKGLFKKRKKGQKLVDGL